MSSSEVAAHYVSADSAPAGFAVRRPVWNTPLFVASYTGLCAALVPFLDEALRAYASVISATTEVPERRLVVEDASISFRPFVGLLIVLLGVFAVGSLRQRLVVIASASSVYLAGVVAADVAVALVGSPLPAPFSPELGLVSGFWGLLVILGTIMTCYELPPRVRVRTRLTSRHHLRILVLCGTGALAIVIALMLARERYFDDAHLRFVGGVDSAFVLYVLALVCLLFVASKRNLSRRPRGGPQLSVAFLVPACNEAHCIADTIASLDLAAQRYSGACNLHVVENGSHDGTAEVAEETLRACHTLRGDVLRCPETGKGRALNWGLARIGEDVVIRIDADTRVDPTIVGRVVSWFWDPTVGGVGGLPLNKPTAPRWLDPLRLIEVRYGVMFLRFAQAAADAVMVMPGLIAAYRRELLDELGGFGKGFNGEDADMTMRIGRLGYRVVTDTEVRVYTEVPMTVAHLREQRQRWARGLWHMGSRNLSTIWMRQGARGLWVLPWSLLNGARRSFAIPVLCCAGTVELLSPTVFALREVSVIAGFIVGLQLIIIVVLLVTGRQFKALPFVPAYLVFRMFRSYCALEAVLSLRSRHRLARAPISAPLALPRHALATASRRVPALVPSRRGLSACAASGPARGQRRARPSGRVDSRPSGHVDDGASEAADGQRSRNVGKRRGAANRQPSERVDGRPWGGVEADVATTVVNLFAAVLLAAAVLAWRTRPRSRRP